MKWSKKGVVLIMAKQYTLLFSCTAAAIALLLIISPMLSSKATAVNLYEVRALPVEETVSCAGRVEATAAKTVTSEIPCVVGKVYVNEGQHVNKGDRLFSIDAEATRAVLVSIGQSDVVAAVTAGEYSSEITAPISGVISALDAEDGAVLDENHACVVITAGEGLQIKISIPETKLKSITMGQTASISGAAFAEECYAGVITKISATARQQYVGTTGETVVDAVITLLETDESLKPGLSAKAEIQISSPKDCVVVPYEYVMQDDTNREFVYVYRGGRAVKQIVETGKELSGGFEILTGLETGEMVITNPEDIPRENTRVTANPEQEGWSKR